MAQARPDTGKVDQLCLQLPPLAAIAGIIRVYKTFSRGLEILLPGLQLLDLHAFFFAATQQHLKFFHHRNLQCSDPYKEDADSRGIVWISNLIFHISVKRRILN